MDLDGSEYVYCQKYNMFLNKLLQNLLPLLCMNHLPFVKNTYTEHMNNTWTEREMTKAGGDKGKGKENPENCITKSSNRMRERESISEIKLI